MESTITKLYVSSMKVSYVTQEQTIEIRTEKECRVGQGRLWENRWKVQFGHP